MSARQECNFGSRKRSSLNSLGYSKLNFRDKRSISAHPSRNRTLIGRTANDVPFCADSELCKVSDERQHRKCARPIA